MLRALRLGAGLILFRAKSYRGQNAPSVSQTRFAPFVGARKRNAVRPAWAQAKRPVCLAGMLRGLCLGAKPILFRAKPYRGQNAPSVSQTHFVGARKRNAVRPAWAQAKRPVCLTGMLRGLRLGAGPIPARETCMEPDKAVRLARNRALSACLGADTAARQTCRDGHVYCKRPNRLPVFTCKPCVLPLAILVECPSAAGNVGEFFASPPHRQKKRPRPVCRCKKRRRGASFGISRTRSVLPPARTDPPIPASRSASSWSLCMQRHARSVLHLPH